MSEVLNLEKALRAKFRFKSVKGNLSVEDLYDLSLEELNVIAVAVHKELKDSTEVSFIAKKSSATATLDLKLEILKHIIDLKQIEEQERKDAAEKRKKKAAIMELIAKKQDEALGAKSVDELTAELLALENA